MGNTKEEMSNSSNFSMTESESGLNKQSEKLWMRRTMMRKRFKLMSCMNSKEVRMRTTITSSNRDKETSDIFDLSPLFKTSSHSDKPLELFIIFKDIFAVLLFELNID